MMIPVLTKEQVLTQLKPENFIRPYSAMYSSLWGGIVTDPSLMLIPLDDHMVHRGDGVFEALKIVGGRIYLLQEHLQRLLRSAEKISLKPYGDLEKLKGILEQTVSAANASEGLVRVFMSRGPGSFSVSPYDTIGTQFFVVITKLTPPSAQNFAEGVKIGRSRIEVKVDWMAQTKSCNYLPNVMMKKEAIDRDLDFMIAFDARGFVAESATENVAILDQNNILSRPKLDYILRGTTMMRVFELAEELKKSKLIQDIQERDILESEVKNAREIMMLGTTHDVLPVTLYEGQKVGSGASAGIVGEVAKSLLQLLRLDQVSLK